MRRGEARRDWTVSEEAFVERNAGRMSVRELAAELGRSPKAVTRKAASMRAQGRPVFLRVVREVLEVCPSCGRKSPSVDRRHGLCQICRLEGQLACIRARTDALLAKLPMELRERYADGESRLGARKLESVPAPIAARVFDTSLAARAEAWEAERVEEALAKNLRRRVKAAQKRKERVQKKVKSMGI